MLQHADRLIDNGYKIIPIIPRTKKPGLYTPNGRWINFHKWNACNISPGDIERWKHWPEARAPTQEIACLPHRLAIP
jgi:hypothetical protein